MTPPVSVVSAKPKETEEEIIIYKSRWIILAVQCLLNITNNMIFVSYAPAGNYVNEYYENKNMTNLMSTIFLGVSVPTIIVLMCFADRLGLRFLIIGATFANALGAGIRSMSTMNGIFSAETNFALALLGQSVTALANPSTLFLNTKIPSVWFPSHQRALATAVAASAGPLGILIVGPLSSSIVQNTSDIFKLNITVFVPAAVTFLISLVVRRSAPLTPPSLTSNTEPLKPLDGLKKILKNRSYLLLVLNLGSGLAYFNLFYTTMESTLCGRGYDNSFSSLTTSLMIGAGLIGATLAGIVVDRTKKFEEIFKICLCLANLFGLAFSEVVIHPDFAPYIATAISLFGFFGIAYYAAGMEISAEITYPVSETMSAGFVGLIGQIEGVIYITVWGLMTTPLPDQYRNIQKCTLPGQTLSEDDLVEQNTERPLYFFSIIGTLLAMISVLFFRPKYLRLSLESKRKESEKKEKLNDDKTDVVVQYVTKNIDIKF